MRNYRRFALAVMALAVSAAPSAAMDSGADVLINTGGLADEGFEPVGYCCDAAEDPTCAAGEACSCGEGVGCGEGVAADGCCAACGKKKAAPKKPNPCAESHKGVFYANDFSYLKDPCYNGSCLGDNLKLMPVGECGEWGTLDVGGQLRLRYHHEEGMGRQPGRSGFEDTTNDFLLTRMRLYSDWKASENFRLYVEGITADETGNSLYVPRPIDVNYGDLLNAFVDLTMTDEFKLRAGRQELLYGNQRLVSPLDWANTRRTFEGVRGLYKSGDWAIDGFYTNLVPVVDDQFDEADYDQSFYGLYSTYTESKTRSWDFYYLGYDDERLGLPAATGDFSLHTFGSRVWGTAHEKWLYELEGAYQGGRQSGLGQDQSAGFTTAGLGRKLDKMAWDPTLWFYFDYASGNYPGGDFNRFNQLFPLGHKYFGFIDAVARSNVMSPNVLLTAKPHAKWDLLMWYYYFEAVSANDIIPPVATSSNQVLGETNFGSELDLTAKYAISARSNILFGYSHLWRGSKIIGTNDADFFYSQWELNF
jgi:hypothetical protein